MLCYETLLGFAVGNVRSRRNASRRGADLVGVFADGGDEEGHAEGEHAGQVLLVQPRQLHGRVEVHQRLAREQARRKAVLVLRLQEHTYFRTRCL
jgi:hypothetical protein